MRFPHPALGQGRQDEALRTNPPNDNLIQLRHKNFERSIELLRKAESSLIELQTLRGNLVDIESVRTELSPFLESLRLLRETMPRRIMIEMERILPRRLQRVSRRIAKYFIPTEKARADEEYVPESRNTNRTRGGQGTVAT